MSLDQSYQITFTDAANRDKVHYGLRQWRMAILVAACDMLCLAAVATVVLFSWSLLRPEMYLPVYLNLIPLVLLFLVVYLLYGLYQPAGLSPVEELRRLSSATTITFLGLGSLSFWFRNAESYSRASFLLIWLFLLVVLPAARGLLRKILARLGWWGEAVALIGMGDQGYEVLQFLQKNPHLGFRPVVLINGFGSHHYPVTDLPVIKLQNLSDDSLGVLKAIRTAVLVQADIPESFLQAIIGDYGLNFSQLILITNTHQFGSLWVTPCDIGGMLGLRIHQNLANRWQRAIKRALDMGVVVLCSPVVLLFVVVIAALVRLDSRGKAFYGHERIGRNGRKFKVWKFRTMVENSDEVLAAYLEHNPEMREEWDQAHKLKEDPRVTRVGRWLRKFSLDELPQIWNVLVGEMSLVGPRPIVDEEVSQYGNRYKSYLLVKPGLSGLWQVSGRNDLDYATRVRLDDYYVRNWSIWFDLYILSRTPAVMLTGKGAY